MELGAFSISLSVRDLDVSREFYEKLGFEVTGGAPEQNYLILKNGTSVVGIFKDMFEGNILTFNPGLTVDGPVDIETDVRVIRQHLVDNGVEMVDDLDVDSSGPAHISFKDPDGNAILIDQFF